MLALQFKCFGHHYKIQVSTGAGQMFPFGSGAMTLFLRLS